VALPVSKNEATNRASKVKTVEAVTHLYSGGSTMKKYILFSLPLLIVLCFGNTAFPSDLVAIQSAQNSKMVRAGVGKESFLAAASDHVQAWEKFRLIKLDGGLVAIQSVQSSKMVRAGVGKESFLAAASEHIQAWEKFRIIPIDK
jgi:hypothetical protein